MNGAVYFSAYDPEHGEQPWISDGTTSGTRMLASLDPNGDSSPRFFAPCGELVCFLATDKDHGEELWRTDGEDLTELVKDLTPGTISGVWPPLVSAGDSVYVQGYDGSHQAGLWRSDGSAIENVGRNGQNPRPLAALGDALLFTSIEGSDALGLWKTDGTQAGTVLVKSLTSSEGGYAFALGSAGGVLYFGVTTPGADGNGLWRTDGTPGGTERVYDVDVDDPSYGLGFAAVGDLAFFSANHQELWKTDGSREGTSLVKGFSNGSNVQMIAFDGSVYFFESLQTGLWKTDGGESVQVLENLALDLAVVNGKLLVGSVDGLLEIDAAGTGALPLGPVGFAGFQFSY